MDRKEHILDSAEALIRSRGFDGFSYADIEKEVGIRKASIHHHFPSKADLSLALIQRYHENFNGKLAAIKVSNTLAMDQLCAFLDSYRDALAGCDMLCLCVALNAGRDSLSQDVRDEITGFYQDSTQWLEALFKLAKKDDSILDVGTKKDDIKLEAAATLASVIGGQLLARSSGTLAQFDNATAQIRARSAA